MSTVSSPDEMLMTRSAGSRTSSERDAIRMLIAATTTSIGTASGSIWGELTALVMTGVSATYFVVTGAIDVVES